jgi:NAD-dependent dihydropyrimidine dehydrogenase PreA subunit
MLLDIVAYVQPALFVMDGVLGLQGDGPGLHGEPRHVGLLLASPDAAALDVTACRVVGIDPGDVPTLRAARTRGWLNGYQGIETLGCQVQDVRVPDYKLAHPNFSRGSGLSNLNSFQKLLRPLFKPGLTPRVLPQREKCTACRTCVRSCPQEAISIVDKLAVVDDERCIRCYCCHELCPEAAIELKFSWLGRFIRRSGGMGDLDTAAAS